jgi:Flp pilus assembly pilin Flp
MSARRVKKERRGSGDKGQMIIEYAVMFTVIVAVIIAASTLFVRPAVNRFYNTMSRAIDTATNIVENQF